MPIVQNTQSSICNVRTVLPLEEIRSKVLQLWPDAEFVGATHAKILPADVEHCHAVIRWHGSVIRWDKFAEWLHNRDPHEYCRAARSWRRSVRYLLHLDNAEKARIPRSALVSSNLDLDDLDELLGSAKMKILDSLVAAQTLPLDQRFAFLVEERGHLPSEVSAALRCIIDLEKFAATRNGHYSALPKSDRQAAGELGCIGDGDDFVLEGFEP